MNKSILVKLIYSLSFLVLCCPAASLASTNDDQSMWFPVGEKLKYKVYWGIVPVGYVELTSEWVEMDGMNFILLRSRAKSNAAIAKIYPVNDVVESTVDPFEFKPWKYLQSLKEGKHIRDDLVEFRWENGIAQRYNNKGEMTKTFKITPGTRDVLCLMYAMRKTGMAPGEQQKFEVVVDDKLYDLEVNALKYEEIDINKYGDVNSLYVEPKAKFGEIFMRKGKLFAWYSLDKRHICLKMIGKVPVANIRVNLVEVTGPGADKWVKSDDEDEAESKEDNSEIKNDVKK